MRRAPADLQQIAGELTGTRALAYGELSELVDAAVRAEQWTLTDEWSRAALGLATVDAFKAENPDTTLTEEQIGERANRRPRLRPRPPRLGGLQPGAGGRGREALHRGRRRDRPQLRGRRLDPARPLPRPGGVAPGGPRSRGDAARTRRGHGWPRRGSRRPAADLRGAQRLRGGLRRVPVVDPTAPRQNGHRLRPLRLPGSHVRPRRDARARWCCWPSGSPPEWAAAWSCHACSRCTRPTATRGFEIVAVDGKRDTDRARKFIADKQLTYTLLENGEGDAEVASRLFGIRAYPSSFLVDREGRVLFFHEGFEDGDDVKLGQGDRATDPGLRPC